MNLVIAWRLLYSVVLAGGGIAGIALGHAGPGIGALVLGGLSLAAFFWGTVRGEPSARAARRGQRR
jgi:hypothetical protein